ncbi:polysaccharide deacetylase family protein [Brasilonema octagenarum UFV-E1]|uniref:Polysaccharide deacetylase family protein n=1 Tax=Brasilonema sennae CENA114 TaxID=415709 RepID=A0A856MJ08_9CYAN|nr:polysaccharide deacetylase family protein [Brasilonema sennae]QDL10668.1 polysaccharide deacetylase family protein [Brasilonema sennae CENA114]QDL17015.1 polysaccharide deacetylase family protein [Brasilonema octagenarum UFV-E1]
MKIPGVSKLRRMAKRLRGRLAPGGLILMYHRITEVESDPWSICVSPRHFAQQMEVLHKFGEVVSLQQLNQTLQEGKTPHWQIAVTFDDGYTDNLYNAKPLLERYDIPATMFLTSGYMEQKRDLWWDELNRLLLEPGCLPEVLCLEINGTTHRWELGTAANYSEEEYQRVDAKRLVVRHRHWRALGEDNPTPRHTLYRTLYWLLSPLLPEARQKVMDQMLAWGDCVPTLRPNHRILNLEEVSTLGSELISIGAHSVTHPFLSFLPTARQREEIQDSKTHLEEIIGQKVVSFAYPHGNYSEETAGLVREAGFMSACTTYPRTVRRQCDRFKLPRVVVEDWDGEEFAKQLSEWRAS